MTNLFSITKLLSFLSLICLLIGSYSFYISWQTLSWESTSGVISYISEQNRGTSFGHKSASLVTNVEEAMYSYTVDGQGFHSYAILNSKKPYTVGNEITVYYNPKYPEQSTIYPGINWVYFFLFISLSLILGIAAFQWHKKIKALTMLSRRDLPDGRPLN